MTRFTIFTVTIFMFYINVTIWHFPKSPYSQLNCFKVLPWLMGNENPHFIILKWNVYFIFLQISQGKISHWCGRAEDHKSSGIESIMILESRKYWCQGFSIRAVSTGKDKVTTSEHRAGHLHNEWSLMGHCYTVICIRLRNEHWGCEVYGWGHQDVNPAQVEDSEDSTISMN